MVIADLQSPPMDLQQMQPGRYRMSIDDYHRTNAVGKSDLDLIARSPAHYVQAKAAPVEPTGPMIFGSAFHVKVLQPDEFPALVAVAPFDSRRTKAYAEWAAAHADRICIMQEEYETICAMHDAIQAHPVAHALMSGGIGETSYFWTDPATGVLCKCRPDYLRADGLIVDLKTCQDASPQGFAKAAAQYRYHVQDAHYHAGVQALEGIDPTFTFLAVEKEPPFNIGLYLPDTTFTAAGLVEREKNLHTYADCARRDRWPGYSTEFQVLSLPNWALKGYDE